MAGTMTLSFSRVARLGGAARALALGMALAVAAAAGQPVSWGDQLSGVGKADPALIQAVRSAPDSTLHVIVREAAPTSSSAEDLVRSLGGTVTRDLRIVGGFSASVPAGSLDELASSPDVWRVWGDARLTMNSVNMSKYDSRDPNTAWRNAINLQQAHERSYGQHVGVAIIDTGVVPVPDLAERVVAVADFTAEGDGMDRYGHGTHLAGLIAGDGTSSDGKHDGVAPEADLISVKVAGWDGATDVSVVIAALQWVVDYRSEYDIRVLNLSFGTDSRQPYSLDPLNFAVEQTWFSGIFVVVSGGNTGPGIGTITKPGDDPYVLTVGAVSLNGTVDRADDFVADFSALGPTPGGFAKPDLLAPGISMVATRNSNSYIDQTHPAAVLEENPAYFKGTGTSQAAAVISGVAALMLEENPDLTPNQVKGTLLATAFGMGGKLGTGAGLVNAAAAVRVGKDAPVRGNRGLLVPSTGLGSLEASRGSLHVYADIDGDGVPELVTGEIDVMGKTWSGNGWGANSWGGKTWSADMWSADFWGANGWGGKTWSANGWGGMAWDANGWGANGWGANGWGANGWGSDAWAGKTWSANAWGANSWGANAWG
jgi:serine protease AprX